MTDLPLREGQMVAPGQVVATIALSQALEDGDSLTALSRSLNEGLAAVAG